MKFKIKFNFCTVITALMMFFVVPVFALPSGYTELEYIQSTGTQYIDTGIVPNKDMHITYTAEFVAIPTGGGSFGGARPGGAVGNGYNFGYTTGSFTIDFFGESANDRWNNAATMQVGVKYKFDVENSRGTLYANDVSVGTHDFNATGSAPGSVLLGAFHNGSNILTYTTPIKIYAFNIEGVFDGVPAKRNSDNVVGMYDTVSNTFFINNGSGSFTAGPEVHMMVATKTYNDAQFTPVVSALQSAITKVNSVVSNTITQAGQIATLATTKQTRPATNCPNGKKCLLVKNPQQQLAWYEILECTQDAFLDNVGTRPSSNSEFGYNVQGTNTDLCSLSGVNCGNNEWVVQYGNGRVYGSAALVSIAETSIGSIVTLNPNSMPSAGNVCVCKINGYSTGSNGVYAIRTNVTTNKWMIRDAGRTGITLANCFSYCTRYDDAEPGYTYKVNYYQNVGNSCSAAAPNATPL